MRGGAEAGQADTVTLLDAGDAEAAEADDSGAQQRGGVEVVQSRWNWKNKIGAGQGVFGVAPVDGVTGKAWGVAEVLLAAPAVGAGAIGASDPGNADASGCPYPFNAWNFSLDDF